MKKPNLSGAAIKQFMLTNVEKVGLGVALFVMGLLIVTAIQKKPREEQLSPKGLEAVAARAKDVIDKGGRELPTVPVAAKFDVSPLLAVIDSSKVVAYDAPTPPAHEITDVRPLRGAPTLFGLELMQAFADRGPFLFKGIAAPAAGPAAPAPAPNPLGGILGGAPAAAAPASPPAMPGTLATGRRYIMFTGLIPLQKQQDEFDRVFAGAQSPVAEEASPGGERKSNPLRDVRYRKYLIERCEIVNGQEKEPVVLDPGPAFREKSTWGVTLPEIVPDSFTLTTDSGAPLTFPLPPLAIRQWDARAAHPKIPLKSDKPAEAAHVQKAEPMKDGDDVFAGGPPKATDAAVAVAAAKTEDAKYRLYRFWDWNVEPGKTYKYRVQMIVVNPNYRVPDRFLRDKALAEKELLSTPWSDWTAPVTIPRDHQMFLNGLEFVKAPVNEAQATVTCVTWDNHKGCEFVKEFKLLRGDMAIFDAPGKAPNPVGGGPIEEKAVHFDPRLLLLDCRGGKSNPDPKKQDNAGEAVFWDMNANQTIVHRQGFDAAEIEAANSRYQPMGRAPGAAPGAAPGTAPPKPPAFDPGSLLLPGPGTTTDPARPKGAPK